MGWNEPDKGKDPWGGKKQPPDLDEALKRFQEKLKKTLLGKTSSPSSGNTPDLKNGNRIIMAASLVIIAILWVLSGIFIVDPAEQATILRFGRYLETVGSGPHWIPRLIDSKTIVNVERVSDYSYSAQMLTKDDNLVSVSVVVQYRIGNLEAYLFNVADPEESLKQATSSALRQVVGNTTLDQIITEGREAWGNRVQDSLIKILDVYKTGIVIVNVSPQPARAPENVQDAFDDAIKAREDEKRFKEQAGAYAARVIPLAQGNAQRITSEAKAYAQQIVWKAKGEVAEFLAILPYYLQSPLVTSERMYLETMQKVLSQSSKVIVDGNVGKMMYLPLEKLHASPTLLPKSLVGNGVSQALNASNSSETMAANRNSIRQTFRPIRN